jgi:hypothetical protein
MTKDELLAALKQIADQQGDPAHPWITEDAHQEADGLLLDYINDEEIRHAFDAIGKWYA